MNIACPKCGFEQPADRFCANCGIDIDNYRAPTKSIIQRLVGSTMFYLALALIMVGGALYLVTKTINKRNDTIAAPGFGVQRTARLDETPVPISETTEVTAQARIRATPVPPQQVALVTPSPVPVVQGVRPQEPASLASRGPKKNSVKVTWAEVNKDYFIELFGESLPYGSFRAGILMEEFNNRTLKSRMDLGRNEKMIRILETTTHTLNLGEGDRRIEIMQRTHDPRFNEKIGVVLNLEPVNLDEAGLQLRFEVRRAVPILQGQRYTIDTLNASDEILIPIRGAAFVSGFIPHREPYDESEQKLFAGNAALKVINSKLFQANQSEIVLFIENAAGD